MSHFFIEWPELAGGVGDKNTKRAGSALPVCSSGPAPSSLLNQITQSQFLFTEELFPNLRPHFKIEALTKMKAQAKWKGGTILII